MSDRKILLSISMLISGRDEMFKSLESLKFFRDAFPCEVILVDTGCNAEQRKRAEAYADKIIDFVWCGDFSAARNAGLKEAEGEWFLYLDDDEWFEEPKEIVNFFLSGEYRNYQCASYAVRNYSDFTGENYEISYPLRMAKRNAELRFEGRIHEYLFPSGEPKKVFSNFVHHYGYVFKNQEERDKHSARNIIPLLEMCEKEPGDPRWSGQLAQEYFGLQQYEKVLEVCKKGLQEWEAHKNSIGYMPAHVGLHYAYILTCLEILGRDEEEEKWLVEALRNELTVLPVMQPTVAFYCLRGVILYHKHWKNDLCSNFLDRYLCYVEKLAGDPRALESGAASIVSMVFDRQNLYSCILTGMQSAIRTENYELVKKASNMLDWTDEGLLGQEKWEREILDAMCSVAEHPLWEEMVQSLALRKGGMQELCGVCAELEKIYEIRNESGKLLRLRSLTRMLDGSHPYLWERRILQAVQDSEHISNEASREELQGILAELFEKNPEMVLQIGDSVWEAVENQRIEIEPMFLKMDYSRWKRGVEKWRENTDLEGLQQRRNRIAGWKQQGDRRYDIFEIKCLEGYLQITYPEETQDGYFEDMLWKYADKVLEFYAPLLRPEVAETLPEALPEMVLLAIRLKKLQLCVDRKADRESLAAVRKCIGVFVPLEKAIERYAELLKERILSRNAVREVEKEELSVLVRTLKREAMKRIGSGAFREAEEILLQIKRCVPEDAETEQLLQQIRLKCAEE